MFPPQPISCYRDVKSLNVELKETHTAGSWEPAGVGAASSPTTVNLANIYWNYALFDPLC